MIGALAPSFSAPPTTGRSSATSPRSTPSTRSKPEIAKLSDDAAEGQDRRVPARSWPRARRSTTCWSRPSPWCARPPSARSASAISTCSWSAAWCCTRAASPRCGPAKARPWSRRSPVYLNALAGKGVHVVTVNDYLAQRDAEWMGQIYRFLGLTVGVIVHGLDDDERKAAYACRHHLRHQQRIRLRLPARQHEVLRATRWSSAATTSPSSTKSTRS